MASKVAREVKEGVHDHIGQAEGATGMQETAHREIQVCGLIRALS
jgi:hypothetical protein